MNLYAGLQGPHTPGRKHHGEMARCIHNGEMARCIHNAVDGLTKKLECLQLEALMMSGVLAFSFLPRLGKV